MKNTLLILLACTALNTAAFAEEKTDKRLITVLGSAQLKVVPDLADLSFSIEERDTDMNKAIKAESEKMKKVISALCAAKIEEKEIQTTQLQITPCYEKTGQGFNDEGSKVSYYRVSQSVVCTTKNISNVGEITGAAINAGVNSVGFVTLRTSEARKIQEDARKKALLDAKSKAQSMAETLGGKIGPAFRISEGFGYAVYVNKSANYANEYPVAYGGAGDSKEIFKPGLIAIDADVSVSFELN